MLKVILVTIVIIALVWESSELTFYVYSKLKGGKFESEEVDGDIVKFITFPDESHLVWIHEKGLIGRLYYDGGENGAAGKVYDAVVNKHPVNRLWNWLENRK